MHDERETQDTLNNITLKIKENLEPIFIDSLTGSNSQFEHLEGIQELVSWYKKTIKEDNPIEKLLEDIINECMKYLPQQYASICVENIKINSKEKKQNVKFNIDFKFEPIRSYVEFVISVNKIRKKTGRIVFEINSTGTINELEIYSEKEKGLKVSLGVISGMVRISIVEVPFIEINEPIEIGSKNIEINLSQYHVDAN